MRSSASTGSRAGKLSGKRDASPKTGRNPRSEQPAVSGCRHSLQSPSSSVAPGASPMASTNAATCCRRDRRSRPKCAAMTRSRPPPRGARSTTSAPRGSAPGRSRRRMPSTSAAPRRSSSALPCQPWPSASGETGSSSSPVSSSTSRASRPTRRPKRRSTSCSATRSARSSAMTWAVRCGSNLPSVPTHLCTFQEATRQCGPRARRSGKAAGAGATVRLRRPAGRCSGSVRDLARWAACRNPENAAVTPVKP